MTRRDFYVASLSGFGGNDVRESVNSYVASQKPSGGTTNEVVRNPCYFRGYETTVRDVTHVGKGNADECLEILRDVIDSKAASSSSAYSSANSLRGRSAGCADDERRGFVSILGDGAPPVQGGSSFYAMTLFYFAYDFARDVVGRLDSLRVLEGVGGGRDDEDGRLARTHKALSVPNPSLRYLLDAGRVVCDIELNFLLRHADWYDDVTAPDKVPYRCLEFLYASTLLRRFGFDDDGRDDVRFAEKIDGREVEWTLGAFLHLVNSDDDGDGGVGGGWDDGSAADEAPSFPSPQLLGGVGDRDSSPPWLGSLVVKLSPFGIVAYVLCVATRRSGRRRRASSSSRAAAPPAIVTSLRHSFNYDDECFSGGGGGEHVKV